VAQGDDERKARAQGYPICMEGDSRPRRDRAAIPPEPIMR
jgi:hypothetical protein